MNTYQLRDPDANEGCFVFGVLSTLKDMGVIIMGHPEDLLAPQQLMALETQLKWLRAQVGKLDSAALRNPNHPAWSDYDQLGGIVPFRQNG